MAAQAPENRISLSRFKQKYIFTLYHVNLLGRLYSSIILYALYYAEQVNRKTITVITIKRSMAFTVITREVR